MTPEEEYIIRRAIVLAIDKQMAVYSDDLVTMTGLTREKVTRVLKKCGFVKSAGNTSKRWVLNDKSQSLP